MTERQRMVAFYKACEERDQWMMDARHNFADAKTLTMTREWLEEIAREAVQEAREANWRAIRLWYRKV